jgi:hemoglobin
MKDAVNGLEIADNLKAELWSYMEMAANSMVNQPD